MDEGMKLMDFETELGFIKNPDIRKFAEQAIMSLPEYFFQMPASTTGKYHPQYALGDGGLLRHTKAAVRIAIELFRIYWWNFTEDEKDLIVVALMLHDGRKKGDNIKFTAEEHPLIQCSAMEEDEHLKNIISDEYFKMIIDGISSHMGGWNKKRYTNEEIMPLPKTQMQKFIHFADYIASRKCLEFNFEVPIKRD